MEPLCFSKDWEEGVRKHGCSPLHPDPGEHTLEGWVFVNPVTSSAVCTAKVTDNMFVCYTREFL